MNSSFVLGVDEVGRGAVAGDLVLGFCLIDRKKEKEIKEFLPGIKDSKKISAKKREYFLNLMNKMQNQDQLSLWCQKIDQKRIDQLGMANCLKEAVRSGLQSIDLSQTKVLLDGGLTVPEFCNNFEVIVKGDEKELSITLASIFAKVTRDSEMMEMSKKFPLYGFDQHKGYGTKKHLELIAEKGVCSLHRKSFLKKFLI